MAELGEARQRCGKRLPVRRRNPTSLALDGSSSLRKRHG